MITLHYYLAAATVLAMGAMAFIGMIWLIIYMIGLVLTAHEIEREVFGK